MSLDKKQIRYWISYYCGGTYENQDIVADLIMKRIEKTQLLINDVSQQRELLIAYEKNHYTPEEWILASEQCIKEIDDFMAINCG